MTNKLNDRTQVGVMKPLSVDFSQAGVCVLESHHAQGFSMAWTRHSFHNVLHIIGGRGRLAWRRGWLALRPGDFIFVRENFSYRIEDESGNPLSLYAICVEREVLQGFSPAEKLSASRNWRMNQALRRILREMLMEQGSGHPEEEVMLHSLATELVVWILRVSSGDASVGQDDALPDLMDSRTRVRAYVRELANRFFEDENLDDTARRVGVSRRGLTSHFREITGESRQACIRRLRIDHARRLLSTTDRSIDAVAFECGFNDLSHFYRSFKMETGKSPRIYRNG